MLINTVTVNQDPAANLSFSVELPIFAICYLGGVKQIYIMRQ